MDGAWRALLLAASRGGESRRSEGAGPGVAIDAQGRWHPCGHPADRRGGGGTLLIRSPGTDWRVAPGTPNAVADFLELYLPLCRPATVGAYVVGHLGQSLDGCIATASGDSCFVTGPENILHLHRMRALCDAVIVGASTVASDDPRLTTRLVSGESPVRVIIDPRRRLAPSHRVFQDGDAETILCCAESHASVGDRPFGRAAVLALPARGDGLDLGALSAALHRRGLRTLFVEGGGLTVSRFLADGLLARLQIAVAPLIIGGGRPGVTRPAAASLAQSLRGPYRLYRMGDDVLFDFALDGDGVAPPPIARGATRRIH